MAANLTVAANKRVRGEILALLYSVQPVPVEIRTITNSLLESNMVSVPASRSTLTTCRARSTSR